MSVSFSWSRYVFLFRPGFSDIKFSYPLWYISGLAQRHLVDAFSLPLLCPKFCHQLMEEVKHFRKNKEDTGEISPGNVGDKSQVRKAHTQMLQSSVSSLTTHSLMSLCARIFSVSPSSSQGTSGVCWNQMTRQAFSWVPDGTFTRSTRASRFSSTRYFKMLVFQKQVLL